MAVIASLREVICWVDGMEFEEFLLLVEKISKEVEINVNALF
jgi:hypothetical protein